MMPPRFISFLLGVLLAIIACKVWGQAPPELVARVGTNSPMPAPLTHTNPETSHTPPGFTESVPVWIDAQIYRDGVRWNAVPGYIYQVFAATSPAGPYTARVSPELPCLGPNMGWPVRTEGPAMFYKVKAVRVVRSIRVPPIDPP